MIRLVFALRRKSGIDVEEFQEHLVRKYGPLMASFGDVLGARKYVQSVTLDGDPAHAGWIESHQQLIDERSGGGSEMEPSYDAVSEVWWDTLDKLSATLSSSEGKAAWAALLAEEQKFIDHANSPLWLAHEYPQVNSLPENLVARPLSNLVKFVMALRHPTSMSLEEAQHHALAYHGPVFRNSVTGMGSVQRYFQVHRFEHELADQLRQARGTKAEPYMYVAELWFPRGVAGEATSEGADVDRIIKADLRKFLDLERSAIQFTKERVFIDHVLCEI